MAHAENYGHQSQQSYPRARNNKAAEETQKANEDERGEAQELTRDDAPEVELFICLREEEHQDKDVVNVCGREGDAAVMSVARIFSIRRLYSQLLFPGRHLHL